MSEKTTERRRDFDGPVSHDRAREAAQRFIDLAFNNKKSERPQLRIPADPNDDDLVLTSYIAQQRVLTSERDEAVRVAGELRAKAAIADQIFASGYMDWYTEEGTQNNVECRFCGEAGLASEFIVPADHCPKVAYDSLTASTGGSSDEPQKEMNQDG